MLNISRPEPLALEDKVEQIRKEAEKKIATMKNKAEAAYYKDDNSIATLTGGKSWSSIINHLTAISHPIRREVVNLAVEQNPPNIENITQMEEALVASSITIESLAQCQQQTASRLDNMDAMLNQILGAITSGQVSSHPDKSSTETGSKSRSGREA